eukprot:Nk52_evm1s138 gene=Nk52_evmTU1s138
MSKTEGKGKQPGMDKRISNRMEAMEQNFEKRLNKLELTMELSESASMVGNTSPAKGNTTNSNHGNGPVYNKTLNNDKSSALNNDKSSALNNDTLPDKKK